MQLGPLIAPSALSGIRKSIGKRGNKKKLSKGTKKKIFYESMERSFIGFSKTQHSFSVTSFTLGFRLFFNLLQINQQVHGKK
jgi:hypothetical protein